VRVSARARHVRLKITAERGLEVIVPAGFDHHHIPAILEGRRRWVEATFEHLGRHRPQGLADTALPEHIHLAAIGARWRVRYRPDAGCRPRVQTERLGELSVAAPDADAAGCAALLQDWLRHQGRIHLAPWIERVSRHVGLPFHRLSVRNQRTRWGSCSSRGSISLNCRLLFLAPELVTHVMVHELCHTVHLNHSPAFWRLVERHEPDFRARRQALHEAWQRLPGWVAA
jgi:predicted metal-dependent hydrolase